MSPKARKPEAQSRRDEILKVAGDLFSEHGVQAVTTRQIAQVVGISQPSIYAHFPSIQAIQDEVGLRSFALLEYAIAASVDEKPEAQLRKAIDGYLDFGMTHPQAYRIAFMLEHAAISKNDGHKDMGAFSLADHPGPRAFGHLVRIVALNRPDLSMQAVQTRSQCLWAALHGLVALILARPHFPWADRKTLLKEQSRLAFNMVFD
ncbi:TetR/AcrR family transcriptional regulator [Hoeflea sp. WL0058]|uniref:TetR/AcrR family transcriptional regulator n=1 Tax=Flavimaribacter sediminis TaxID=2865987 RepID=A0AAE2ZMI5_9HYPH|nr:TetR/AcrR family transcriptional regulator [Flavimaribacter sediminis]MBW8638936.1 TetR/AcrR family transcriptional regulator [Flavimaribacter sediminis]